MTASRPASLEELFEAHSAAALRFAYLLTGDREIAASLPPETASVPPPEIGTDDELWAALGRLPIRQRTALVRRQRS